MSVRRKNTAYKVHISESFGRDVIAYAADPIEATERVEELCNGEINITSKDNFEGRSVETADIATAEEIRRLDEYRKDGKSVIKDKTRRQGDYVILHRMEIGETEIVVGQYDKAAYGMKYVVAASVEDRVKRDEIFYTNDEMAAMAAYGNFIAAESKALHEKQLNAIERELITEDQCIPFDEEENLFGKVVVLRPYKPTQLSDWQIRIAVGGSPWYLRCAKISNGGQRRLIDRDDIIGILKPECYPDWVTERLRCITEGKQRRTDFIEVEGE